MKKKIALLLLIGTIFFSSCIKDLEQRGVYETTRCYGVILDSRTEQPMANVRIVTTNHSKVDETVYSKEDGTFEIPVHVEKLVSDYYIYFEADTLFQSFEIKVNDLDLGKESYDLGKIYFLGAVVPSVHTVVPDNITTTSAHLVGVINDFGYSEITERGFVYGTMQYPTLNNTVVSVAAVGDTFAADLPLTPHTTYYFRAYAVNSMGVGYGNQVAVTTLSGLPVVTTDNVFDVTANSALGGGRVVSDGGFPIIARGVCWSVQNNPTIANRHTIEIGDTGSFKSEMHNLLPGTVYFVRAYAQNEAGVSYGPAQSFNTLNGLPFVTTAEVSAITATSALAGGTVVADSGYPILRRGICFGTEPMPTIEGRHTTDGVGLGDYVSQMTNLTSGTTYYYRAYAVNGVGTVYGAEYTFVTE